MAPGITCDLINCTRNKVLQCILDLSRQTWQQSGPIKCALNLFHPSHILSRRHRRVLPVLPVRAESVNTNLVGAMHMYTYTYIHTHPHPPTPTHPPPHPTHTHTGVQQFPEGPGNGRRLGSGPDRYYLKMTILFWFCFRKVVFSFQSEARC